MIPPKPIQNKTEMPKTTHFAALVFKTSSIYHEGDERSRTNPGHGYPAHTETIHTTEYIPFNSKGDLEKWVTEQEKSFNKAQYTIIESRPVSFEVKTHIEFKN